MALGKPITRIFLLISGMLLTACGGGGSGGGSGSNPGFTNSSVDLDDFAEASVVIGQPDFAGQQRNRGGSIAANTLDGPRRSAGYSGDVLYLGDSGNNRVLGYQGIPQTNGAGADFVLGQSDFTSEAVGDGAGNMISPSRALVGNDRLFVSDSGNYRVLMFDPAPESGPADADVVLGQSDFGQSSQACAASGMNNPASITKAGDRLVVADKWNNRVLIWNSVPATNGAEPDLVLGQDTLDTCAANDDNQNGSSDGSPSARTLDRPSGVWSDGDRLIVTDLSNNRLLIWNSFPTSSFESADVVLGQEDFSGATENDENNDGSAEGPTDRTMFWPAGVDSNGEQIFLADSLNNRILVWDSFPDSNFAPADHVLGQADFTHNTANDDDRDGTEDNSPTARTLSEPEGITLLNNQKLIVTDTGNSRYLIFEE